MDSNKVNIEEYWNEVHDIYDIDFEEFNLICRAPFKFVKKIMSLGSLKNIRFKYFGIFEVSKSRVKYSKKAIEKNYKEGKISKERYDKRISILNNYVEQD